MKIRSVWTLEDRIKPLTKEDDDDLASPPPDKTEEEIELTWEKDFSPQLLKESSLFSEMVYADPNVFKEWLESEGLTKVEIFGNSLMRAIGFSSKERSYLVFRGTDQAPDWIFNGLVFWWPVNRHFGFALAWNLFFRLGVCKWIKTLSPDQKQFVVTGHSLGGALAMMAANWLRRKEGVSVENIVTFGAP